MTRRVVVVGGGLTGLATAWHLRDDVEVTLLEAGDRLGGQIRTVGFAGAPLDVGADAFLARQPEGPRLARAAGVADGDLVAPAAARVALWVDGRLRPLPAGTVLGVPTDLPALARSGVLPPPALARAGLEPALPRRRVVGDRSVADLVGERFGPAVVDRLVEPLLGGVYAGRADRLSAEATTPAVWEAALRHRSLLLGLRAGRAGAAPGPAGPVFVTVRQGLGDLVDRLGRDLGDRVRLRTPAVGLRRGDDGRWAVRTGRGELDADHVVLAVPPAAACELLAAAVPDAARELLPIRAASVAVVALAYAADAARAAPDLSGVLVPRSEGRLVKAVTLSSRKWAHHADRRGFVVRASVGRVDDASPLGLDDDELARRVDGEVRWALRITAPATERLVVRWPRALPQYDVGHLGRVERLRSALAAGPGGLHVGGAGLDGVGLSARARDAGRLAHEVRTATGR